MSEQKEKKCKGDFKERDDFAAVKKRLKEGNKKFMDDHLAHPNEDKKRRACTKKNGQKPFAIVLSCADSRVVPELIFDTGLGDLFVIRVAGNIANISSIASIEYGLAVLGCKYILVLGHESCGAVKEAMSDKPAPSDNLSHLLGHILPAVNACDCKGSISNTDYETVFNDEVDKVKSVTIANIRHSMSELTRCSKIIRKVASPTLSNPSVIIKGAYYHLKTGKVKFLK